jgi:site-specific recombinase XerD
VVDEEQDPSDAVTLVVSGEFLPGEDAERETMAPGRALVPVREPTIDEMLEAFRRWMRLDVADGNASPHTLRTYYSDVRQHLEWLAARGLTPVQASEDDLKRYRAGMVERYAVSTVGRKLSSIRRFYGMAMARGALPQNPAAGLKAPRDNTARHERVKYLPLETVRRVLAAPNPNKAKGIRDRAIMVLMAMHGLRVVEVHRLNMDEVDLEAGEAGQVRVFGKGDKWRTILLVEQTREILRMWLAARALMRPGSPAVFLNMHWNGPNERISTRGIRAMVNGYLEDVGAKREGISCHALRHSFATLSLAAGGSLLAISGALGHASVTTTQVYAKIVDKAKHNPAKLLGGLLE